MINTWFAFFLFKTIYGRVDIDNFSDYSLTLMKKFEHRRFSAEEFCLWTFFDHPDDNLTYPSREHLAQGFSTSSCPFGALKRNVLVTDPLNPEQGVRIKPQNPSDAPKYHMISEYQSQSLRVNRWMFSDSTEPEAYSTFDGSYRRNPNKSELSYDYGSKRGPGLSIEMWIRPHKNVTMRTVTLQSTYNGCIDPGIQLGFIGEKRGVFPVLKIPVLFKMPATNDPWCNTYPFFPYRKKLVVCRIRLRKNHPPPLVHMVVNIGKTFDGKKFLAEFFISYTDPVTNRLYRCNGTVKHRIDLKALRMQPLIRDTTPGHLRVYIGDSPILKRQKRPTFEVLLPYELEMLRRMKDKLKNEKFYLFSRDGKMFQVKDLSKYTKFIEQMKNQHKKGLPLPRFFEKLKTELKSVVNVFENETMEFYYKKERYKNGTLSDKTKRQIKGWDDFLERLDKRTGVTRRPTPAPTPAVTAKRIKVENLTAQIPFTHYKFEPKISSQFDLYLLSFKRGFMSQYDADFNYNMYLPKASRPARVALESVIEGKWNILQLYHVTGLHKSGHAAQITMLPQDGSLYFYPDKTKVTAENAKLRWIRSGRIFYRDALNGSVPTTMDTGAAINIYQDLTGIVTDFKKFNPEPARPHTYFQYSAFILANITDGDETPDIIHQTPTSVPSNASRCIVSVYVEDENDPPVCINSTTTIMMEPGLKQHVPIKATDVDNISHRMAIKFINLPTSGILYASRINKGREKPIEQIGASDVYNEAFFNFSTVHYAPFQEAGRDSFLFKVHDVRGGISRLPGKVRLLLMKNFRYIEHVVEDKQNVIQLRTTASVEIVKFPRFGILYQYIGDGLGQRFSPTKSLVQDPQARVIYVSYYQSSKNDRFSYRGTNCSHACDTRSVKLKLQNRPNHARAVFTAAKGSPCRSHLHGQEVENDCVPKTLADTSRFTDTLVTNQSSSYFPFNLSLVTPDKKGRYRIQLLVDSSYRLNGELAMDTYRHFAHREIIVHDRHDFLIDFTCDLAECNRVLQNIAYKDKKYRPHTMIMTLGIMSFGTSPDQEYIGLHPFSFSIGPENRERGTSRRDVTYHHMFVIFQNHSYVKTNLDLYRKGKFRPRMACARLWGVFPQCSNFWPLWAQILIWVGVLASPFVGMLIGRKIYKYLQKRHRRHERMKPANDQEYTLVLAQLGNLLLDSELQAATTLIRCIDHDSPRADLTKVIVVRSLIGVLDTEKQSVRFVAAIVQTEIEQWAQNDVLLEDLFAYPTSAGLVLLYYFRHVGRNWIQKVFQNVEKSTTTEEFLEHLSVAIQKQVKNLPPELIIVCQVMNMCISRALETENDTIGVSLSFVNHFIAPVLSNPSFYGVQGVSTPKQAIRKLVDAPEKYLHNVLHAISSVKARIVPCSVAYDHVLYGEYLGYLHSILHVHLDQFSMLAFEERDRFNDVTIVARVRQVIDTLYRPIVHLDDVLSAASGDEPYPWHGCSTDEWLNRSIHS